MMLKVSLLTLSLCCIGTRAGGPNIFIPPPPSCAYKSCSYGKVCIAGECVCQIGVDVGGHCFFPTVSQPHPTITIFPLPCERPCPDDRVCRNGKCVCKSGKEIFGECDNCEPPKVISTCAQTCKLTCDNLDDPPICPAICMPAITCVCPPGYVEKSESDDTCVLKENCQKTCPSPKIFNRCPTACPTHCGNRNNPPQICTANCRPGVSCVCPPGMIEWDATDHRCVYPEACDVKCPVLKEFNGCPTACPVTCENINDNTPRPCPAVCRPGVKCVCKKGFIEKSSRDSTCVRPSECPKDPCTLMLCPPGTICKNGKCVPLIVCPVGKKFDGCPTACPVTCDNINDNTPRPCPAVCRPGVKCVCKKGFVEKSSKDSTCVRPSECPKDVPICQLRKDPGPCKGSIPSYYFNAFTGKCEKFYYGGCEGNANRFPTLKQCQLACSVCKLNKDPGPCEGYFPRYFYNQMTKKCEKFYYGGCQGNANNFETLDDCRKTCGKTCPPPKIFNSCPTACPIHCGNRKFPPQFCTDNCRPGVTCVCPPGMIEWDATDHRCVYPEACDVKCPVRKEFDLCPTACPVTCDNVNDNTPRPCTANCRPGVKCVCKKGFIEKSSTDSTCVRPSECPKDIPICQLPKDVGPCDGNFLRFYFDAVEGRCKRFSYGGCRGNKNRFDTRKECEKSCSVCKLNKDPGPCEAAITRYFYNRNIGDCKKFIYGGCQGNANRFNTLEACRKRCADPCISMLCPTGTACKNGQCISICELDKDPGPCEAAITSYFYNKKTGDCEKFIYGGCQGNANRFKTVEACRKRCADPCISMLCPPGSICKNGQCSPIDKCFTMFCPVGSVCRDGQCLKRCGGRICGPNSVCIGNTCICLSFGGNNNNCNRYYP